MKAIEDISLEKAKKKFYGSLVLLVLSIIYLISPIDLIPDILPPVTYIDDLVILGISCLSSWFSYRKLRKERERLSRQT